MDFLVLKYLLWAVALGALSAFSLPLGSAIGLKIRPRATLISLLDEEALRFWFIKWRMGLHLALFGDVATAWYTGPEFGENFIAGFGGGLRLTRGGASPARRRVRQGPDLTIDRRRKR